MAIRILCDDDRREKGLREYAAQHASEVKPIQSEAESVGELTAQAERKVNRYAAALGDEDDDIAAAALRQQMAMAAQELARLRERQAKIAGLIEQHEISQGKIDEIRRNVRYPAPAARQPDLHRKARPNGRTGCQRQAASG